VFLSHGLPEAGDAPVPHLRGLLILVALFQLAFAAWGVCNAVGLLRLRVWARVSVLFFAGVLVLLNGSAFFGGLIALGNLPAGSPGVTAAGAALLPRVLMVLVGIWWLVLFNTRRMKDAFAASAQGPESRTS
jgi:hypothetical protein